MNKNDSGFLAVVTNGDSKAIINAYTSGVRTNFNQVFSEFIIREQDSVTFREKQWNEKRLIYLKRTFQIKQSTLLDIISLTRINQTILRWLKSIENI